MASVDGWVARRFRMGENGQPDSEEPSELHAELIRAQIEHYQQQRELAKTLDEESNARALLLGVEYELRSLELEQLRKERATVVAEAEDGTKVMMPDLMAQERIARAESAIRRANTEARREKLEVVRRQQGRPHHRRGRQDGFKNVVKGKEALEQMKKELSEAEKEKK